MRTLVIGDIHGAYRALEQVLSRAKYDPASDRLISVGDLCDGWPDVSQVLDFFIKCDGQVFCLMGNHDKWTLKWMRSGIIDPAHLHQGGKATILSLEEAPPIRFRIYQKFLESLEYFYKQEIDGGTRYYVHAGIPLGYLGSSLDNKGLYHDLVWDREMITLAARGLVRPSDFVALRAKEIFIGHTPVQHFDHSNTEPTNYDGIWNIDTGAGWARIQGKLTIMNVDTKEFWQSDLVQDLYPGVVGR